MFAQPEYLKSKGEYISFGETIILMSLNLVL